MTLRNIVRGLVIASMLTAVFTLPPLSSPAAAGEKIPVFVSIPPQRFLAERIAGERASISVMVDPGRSPATYEPTPKQMSLLSDARIYFSIGVPFEEVWIDRIAEANPGMKVVDTAGGIATRIAENHVHEGGEGGGRDPHIWTNPRLALQVARVIADAFIAADEEHRVEYESNLNRLSADLARLDGEIREILGNVTNRKFLVFHPSWGYFADAYGLEQIAIESGGGEPGARHLSELLERAEKEGLKTVFVQKQFSPRTAGVIADALGGKVVAVDPLAEDYVNNLREAAALFAESMR